MTFSYVVLMSEICERVVQDILQGVRPFKGIVRIQFNGGSEGLHRAVLGELEKRLGPKFFNPNGWAYVMDVRWTEGHSDSPQNYSGEDSAGSSSSYSANL